MGTVKHSTRRLIALMTTGLLATTLGVGTSTAQADVATQSAPSAGSALAAVGGLTRSSGDFQATGKRKKAVIFVGNNWDGTAHVLDQKLRRLARINIIPDYEERMQEIVSNPYRLGFFLGIRELIGEGNDQFVDDMYSSNNGRLLIVSRPSFADVVAIDLKTKKVRWRFRVAGERSDHMAISPDGKTVIVSASTGNVVHALRVSDGKEVGQFPSGGSPHENVYIQGGKKILHASIGTVYSPGDDAVADPAKGERVFQIVDARTYEVKRRYDLRKALDDNGLDNLSTAVRPLTLSPDESSIYFQVSFFHGFLKMDRRTGKIRRVYRLPNLVKTTPREQYVLDSAHHGIAINPSGKKICVSGTMSDYAVVVDAKSKGRKPLVRKGTKPYWVTPSRDGKFCLISWSGNDKVSKISYRTGKAVRSQQVGDHPQRIRNGVIRKDLLGKLGFTKPTILLNPNR